MLVRGFLANFNNIENWISQQCLKLCGTENVKKMTKRTKKDNIFLLWDIQV